MMRLSLMKSFFDTVDDAGRSTVADALLGQWAIGSSEARCIRASANFVFRVATESRAYVLRFNHASERSAAEYRAEMEYVRLLQEGGVRVNQPVPSAAGRLVETVETQLGCWHAVLFQAIEGEILSLDSVDVARWGALLAEVHSVTAAGSWQQLERRSWHDQLDLMRSMFSESQLDLWRYVTELEARLDTLSSGEEEQGLIHGDFELDNILWVDGEPTIVDCDDCCRHWYAADIAAALRDIFTDGPGHPDLTHPMLRRFVAGYRERRPLPETWVRKMPLLLRLNDLLQLGRIARAIDGESMAGEPAWAVRLRQKLTREKGRILCRLRHPLDELVDS